MASGHVGVSRTFASGSTRDAVAGLDEVTRAAIEGVQAERDRREASVNNVVERGRRWRRAT